ITNCADTFDFLSLPSRQPGDSSKDRETVNCLTPKLLTIVQESQDFPSVLDFILCFENLHDFSSKSSGSDYNDSCFLRSPSRDKFSVNYTTLLLSYGDRYFFFTRTRFTHVFKDIRHYVIALFECHGRIDWKRKDLLRQLVGYRQIEVLKTQFLVVACTMNGIEVNLSANVAFCQMTAEALS